MRSLVHAEAKIMPPQFFAALSVKAQRQQGFWVFLMRCDEHPVAIDDRRAGPPARQLHRPANIFGLTPANREFAPVGDTIGIWPSPSRPIACCLLAQRQEI